MPALAPLVTTPLRAIVDFVLPPRCPSCGVIVTGTLRLCLDCWSRLDFLAPDAGCAGCGTPFADAQPEGSLCGRCLEQPPRHDGVRAVVAMNKAGQQSWTTQGYLSYALREEHLNQPHRGNAAGR